MKTAICAEGFEILEELPQGCLQSDMMKRQRRFQDRLGKLDVRLKDYGAKTFCLPYVVLHNLDMGIQECGEAWDMVEGGWKHHKTQPQAADPDELLMELIDVAHFAINAYLFMGGQYEPEMVAAAVGRSRQEIKLPRIDFEAAWGFGERSWKAHGSKLEALYGHGRGAHGQDWEKTAATRINYLREKMTEVAMTMRNGMKDMSASQRTPENFPAASGYVFIEIFPWLYGAAQAIPGCTKEVFYSAFVHKNDINFARQDRGY